MRVIVTGGGTGGHIYPALAIADKLKETDPEAQILYVGCSEGIEKEVVPKSGYDMELVDARWFDRVTPAEIVKTGVSVSKGVVEAMKIIKRFKADVIIGTGGYVCFPVIIAGRLKKCLCYLHEQNAFPGLANRTLERYVENVFLGFPDAGSYFKYPEKHINAGNPVRKNFFKIDKKQARETLGIPQDDFAVFTFGGSLGSEKINEIAVELAKVFNGHGGVRLTMGTGKWYYRKVMDRIAEEGVELCENISVKGYIDNMDLQILACDVVISRAGALSVAETTVCGKAAILIPSPNVTGNHQYYNAKAVADRGGALLIEEKDLRIPEVVEEVLRLRNNPQLCRAMSAASRACAPDKALDIICRKITRDYKNR